MHNDPFTGFNLPSNDSSPMNAHLSEKSSTTPIDCKIAIAIARSSWEPSFLKFAGAKLIVIRFTGNLIPVFSIAERTLSLDSFIEVSGRPTMLNERRPFARSHSHSTTYPFNPSKQHVFTFEYIISPCYLIINVISIEKWTTQSYTLVVVLGPFTHNVTRFHLNSQVFIGKLYCI